MKLSIGYGEGVQEFEAPDENLLGVMQPNTVQIGLTGAEEIARALNSPIASPPLRHIVQPGEKAAIIISDNTRPMPSYQVLPGVLDELEKGGVLLRDITVVVALGIHRPQTESEIRKLAGDEAFSRVRCVNSTPGDCVRMGVTSSGTPVDVSRAVAEADRRIAIGNIEYQ